MCKPSHTVHIPSERRVCSQHKFVFVQWDKQKTPLEVFDVPGGGQETPQAVLWSPGSSCRTPHTLCTQRHSKQADKRIKNVQILEHWCLICYSTQVTWSCQKKWLWSVHTGGTVPATACNRGSYMEGGSSPETKPGFISECLLLLLIFTQCSNGVLEVLCCKKKVVC